MEKLNFDKRDEFNRKPIAEKVIRLLESSVDVSPLVIDGSWGAGKTEFCHKLIQLYKEQEQANTPNLIYIDAFEADHTNEPLLMIIAAILGSIDKEEIQHDFVQKILPGLRYGLKTTLRAAVSHLLKQDAADVVDGFESEIQGVANKAIDVSVELLLKDHAAAEKNMQLLRQAISELAAQPLVVFIDELDRCRPDFAVSVLEVIKHVFSIDNVQFVLVTNASQLKAVINHSYGAEVDAQRYLDKFVRFSFSLPDDIGFNPNEDVKASVQHYQNLISQSDVLKQRKLEKDAALGLMINLINVRKLSLREVETFVRHLEIAQLLSDDGHFIENLILGYQLLRLLGVFIACFNPQLAKAIQDDNYRLLDLAELIGIEELPVYEGGYPYPSHLEVVFCTLSLEHEDKTSFIPSGDEEKQAWTKLISQCFNGRARHDRLLSIVQGTLNTLILSNKG